MAFVNKNGIIMTSDGIPYMYSDGPIDPNDITFLYGRTESSAANESFEQNQLLAWGNGRLFRSASEDLTSRGKVYGYHPKINDYTPVEYIASDRAAADYFGWSVTAGFGKVAMGAPGHDDPDPSCGAVYIYDYEGTSSEIKITPSDITASDNFGRNVQIMNNKLYVLSYTGNDTDNCKVYKFNLNWSATDPIQKQTVYNVADGTVMAAANGLIAVSDWTENIGTKSNAGRVQILDENLSLIKTIEPTGSILNKFAPAFGHALAMGSGRLLINGDIFSAYGDVHIYNYNFQRLKTLEGEDYVDTTSDNKFGYSVDVGFGYIAVGCPGYNGGGAVGDRQGAVFLFDLDGNLIKRIDPSVTKAYDQRFGTSVALGPGRLAVLGDLERRTEVYELPQRFTPFDVSELHRGKW